MWDIVQKYPYLITKFKKKKNDDDDENDSGEEDLLLMNPKKKKKQSEEEKKFDEKCVYEFPSLKKDLNKLAQTNNQPNNEPVYKKKPTNRIIESVTNSWVETNVNPFLNNNEKKVLVKEFPSLEEKNKRG